MDKLETLFGVSFLAIILSFIIPQIQTKITEQSYSSGMGLILNNYALIIIVVVVAIVVSALILEGKD